MQTTAQGGAGLDGVYRPVGGNASGSSRCGTTNFGYPITVANGVGEHVQTDTAGDISGTVAPDGSLMIEHGRGKPCRASSMAMQFNGTLTASAAARYTHELRETVGTASISAGAAAV